MLTILMDQEAIESALTAYVGSTAYGVDLSEQEVSIKLIAGRAGNGWRAEVNLTPRRTIQPAAAPATDGEQAPIENGTTSAPTTPDDVEADVTEDDDGPNPFLD